MSKRIITIIISWLLVIVTILVIAKFSLEDGEKSTETSNSFVEVIVPNYDELSSDKQEQASFSVRKIAHFSIYFLLGLCLFNAFSCSIKLSSFYYLLLSSYFASVYSFFDEFVLQAMSVGRAPQFLDCFIDITGAFFGSLLYLVILKIFIKIKIGTHN